jgi:hypothetical protein
MFNFLKKKTKLPYEEFGYKCADSLLLDDIELLALSARDWIGEAVNSEKLGRDLASVSFVIFELSLTDLIGEGDARRRAIEGFLKRISERYENYDFHFDRSSIDVDYLQIAAEDLRNGNRNERFPTLVPLVTTKITGLQGDSDYWPDAYAVVRSFTEKVLKTLHQAFHESKYHSRLV